jgi:futalosine hydrolase
MILVVAATERELAGAGGATTTCCGVGPVEAAAATAATLIRHRPWAVLHIGIAGARRASGIHPPSLIIGTEARYCDMTSDWAPRLLVPAAALVAAAERALPQARLVPIGTSARVGGTTGCDVEAMEGFAVLRAAARANVPAIEVRAISNEIEEPDRARWHVDEALAALAVAVPLLCNAMTRDEGRTKIQRPRTQGRHATAKRETLSK